MSESENTPFWSNRLKGDVGLLNVKFCAGRDMETVPMADGELVPFDIWNTAAHVVMLAKQRIISTDERNKILEVLNDIKNQYEAGEFKMNPALEDVHMNIEHVLLEKLGNEIGGKVHTGRSRNDQAACTMRLYLRDNLLKWEEDLIKLMESLLKLAEDHRDTIMPGYSHRQIATISSFAHLLLNYYQSFDRDLKRSSLCYDFLDACPLGAAAGFGTTWPIDRQAVARYMGFKSIDENALDCVSSRSEIEGQVAECLTFFLIHSSRIAQDFIYLSASEVKMLVLPDHLVTGSSIMPQKRNPDGLEIIIGKASIVEGLYNSILGLATGKRSGYNREYQWGKYLVMDALRETDGVSRWLTDCIHHLKINRDVMYRTASSGFINAVDVADGLAKIARISFRDAYKITATAVSYSSDEGEITLDALIRSMEERGVSYKISPGVFVKMIDPRKNLNARKAIGGPAPEEVTRQIHQNSQKLLERRIKLHEKQKQIETAWENTWNKLNNVE